MYSHRQLQDIRHGAKERLILTVSDKLFIYYDANHLLTAQNIGSSSRTLRIAVFVSTICPAYFFFYFIDTEQAAHLLRETVSYVRLIFRRASMSERVHARLLLTQRVSEVVK